MKEFVSKLEEIMPAEELVLASTPAFGPYKEIMPNEAVQHPAKFNTLLVEFLIKKFTEEGSTILDPMCGTGVLGVIASLHNRNAIQIDIEKKFINWAEKARENVERLPSLTPKGWIKNICGDARKLSELLGKADACITSPPYSETFSSSKAGRATRLGETKIHEEKQLGRPYTKGLNKDNIGNLPHGSIDSIITSPPYLKSADKGSGINKQRPQDVKIGCSTIGKSIEHPDAIDNTKDYGSIDSIITSPPYSESISKRAGGRMSWCSKGQSRRMMDKYSENHENLSNLPHGEIDSIITSPPYEETMSEKRHYTPSTGRSERLWQEKHLGVYPYSNGQIGAFRKETYLSAMLKVYSEMYKVLKDGGRAIIVIKPFVRKKKIVDLPYHTWLLLEKVGFKLEKLFKLRLQQESFWRLLYYKKHPDVPKIAHEYVLVCRKSN